MGCNNRPQKTKFISYQASKKLNVPTLFSDGKISTSNGICFSPDGNSLYTSNAIDKTFTNGKNFTGIFVRKFETGEWSSPSLISLNDLDAYHPVVSADGKKLFFNSRSNPDSINQSIPHNIWFASKTASGWSDPEMVEGVNSDSYDSYPSIAKNDNLYFNSAREGGKGGMDIYVSYFQNGQYQRPINLEAINSTDVENDLVVDPEERFIIFNRYVATTHGIDLFISFKEDGVWDAPRKLDINSDDQWELTPTLSPDGKYFFYELNNQIMQIDLSEILKTN